MYYGPGTNDLSFTPLTRAEEGALFERYYSGDLAARDELIQKHLRFVAKLSIAFAKRALHEDEAISAGNFGLLQALNSKRFKPGFGVMFSTYLRSWVQGEIRKALREKGENHPPMSPILNFYGDGAALTGNPAQHQMGTESAVYVRAEEEFAPSVADLYAEQQINGERRIALDTAMKLLSPLEKAVVHGIVHEEKQYSELGRENGVSRQACKKAHIRAFKKLREALEGQYADLK